MHIFILLVIIELYFILLLIPDFSNIIYYDKKLKYKLI
jgi:hypothetical protein